MEREAPQRMCANSFPQGLLQENLPPPVQPTCGEITSFIYHFLALFFQQIPSWGAISQESLPVCVWAFGMCGLLLFLFVRMHIEPRFSFIPAETFPNIWEHRPLVLAGECVVGVNHGPFKKNLRASILSLSKPLLLNKGVKRCFCLLFFCWQQDAWKTQMNM